MDISLIGNLYNDYSNNYGVDISCNNISVKNDIKVGTLTTDKTKILSDGTLEIYFAGDVTLPTKGGNAWWNVVDELSEAQKHLIQLDVTTSGHTTALSQVNLEAVAATEMATTAGTTATKALNIASADSAALTAMSATLIGGSFSNTIKQTIKSNAPIHVDDNVTLSLNIDSNNFAINNNNLTFSNSFYTTFDNMKKNIDFNIANIEQLNDNVTNIETGVTNLNNHLNTTDANLEKAIISFNNSISNVQTDLNSAKSNILTLQTDVNTAKTNITTLQSDVNTAKSNISTLQSDVNTAKTNITTLQTNITATNNNLTNNYLTTSQITDQCYNKGSIASFFETADTNLDNEHRFVTTNFYNKTEIDSKFSTVNTSLTTLNTNIQSTLQALNDVMSKSVLVSRFSFMPSNTIKIASLNNNEYYYYQINLSQYCRAFDLETSNDVQNVRIRRFNICTYIRDGWLTNSNHDNLQYNNFEIMMTTPIAGPGYGDSNYVLNLKIRSTLVNNPELNQEYNSGNGFIISCNSFNALLFLTKSPTFINAEITDLL